MQQVGSPALRATIGGALLGSLIGEVLAYTLLGTWGIPVSGMVIGGWLGYRRKRPRTYATTGIRRRKVGGPLTLAGVILGVPLVVYGAVRLLAG